MAVRPTKWQRKREASHLALVRSAMHRFHEHGYAATRVEDIVQGTGYSKGAFYFHFANKLDCFWQTIAYREQLRGNWTGLPEGHDPETSSLETLLRSAMAGFAESLEGLNAWVLVMVDCYQQHHDDEEALARLRSTYDGWRGEIARFIRALQEGGWVAKSKDADLLATQLFAYREGLTVHARLYGLAPDTFEDALNDGVLSLLTGPGQH